MLSAPLKPVMKSLDNRTLLALLGRQSSLKLDILRRRTKENLMISGVFLGSSPTQIEGFWNSKKSASGRLPKHQTPRMKTMFLSPRLLLNQPAPPSPRNAPAIPLNLEHPSQHQSVPKDRNPSTSRNPTRPSTHLSNPLLSPPHHLKNPSSQPQRRAAMP